MPSQEHYERPNIKPFMYLDIIIEKARKRQRQRQKEGKREGNTWEYRDSPVPYILATLYVQ